MILQIENLISIEFSSDNTVVCDEKNAVLISCMTGMLVLSYRDFQTGVSVFFLDLRIRFK